MKVAFIDKDNSVHNDMYHHYGDIYRELTKLYTVDLYSDPGQINAADYELIFYGFSWFAAHGADLAQTYRNLLTTTPVIGLLLKHQNQLPEKLEFIRRNKFNLIADPDPNFAENAKVTGKKTCRLWLSTDPKLFKPKKDWVARSFDLGFSGAMHGGGKLPGETKDVRVRAYEVIKTLGLDLDWNGSDSVVPRIKSWEQYAGRMADCKMWLATTGPIYDVNPRYFELALTKTLILCNECPKSYKDLFVDGETCVTFKNDLSNLESKIRMYLLDTDSRKRITQKAYDLVINGYTNEHITKNLIEYVL